MSKRKTSKRKTSRRNCLQLRKSATAVLFGLIAIAGNSRASTLSFSSTSGPVSSDVSFDLIGGSLMVTLTTTAPAELAQSSQPSALFFTFDGANVQLGKPQGGTSIPLSPAILGTTAAASLNAAGLNLVR